MTRFLFILGVVASFFVMAVPPLGCAAGQWQELKAEHFIAYYNFKEDLPNIQLILRKAEEYYKRIAEQIGYSRYSNFWTWEDRAKIIIFPDQQTFIRNTGQPAWSAGYSGRDSELFHSRIIVTYRQEQDFLYGLLPHEIGHLILHDFVGFDTPVPLWFDEGVAQLQEINKKDLANQFMRPLAQQKHHVPFPVIMNWDIRKESDTAKVKIFYAQSLSMVDFMIKNYGSSAFGNLCRNFKEGKNMEGALRAAYASSIDSLNAFERRWAEYATR